MSATKEWGVAIVRRKTNEPVKTIPCWSMREAMQVQRGVEINLNRKDFRAQIVFPDKATQGVS